MFCIEHYCLDKSFSCHAMSTLVLRGRMELRQMFIIFPCEESTDWSLKRSIKEMLALGLLFCSFQMIDLTGRQFLLLYKLSLLVQ